MDKKMRDIRKLLGNKYHLSESFTENGQETWILFKKYDNPKIYFSDDNEAIMSSETNSVEELYKFAKEHHEIDEHRVILKLGIIVAWIALVIILINIITVNNSLIRGIGIGVSITTIIYSYIEHNVWLKNNDIKIREIRENFKWGKF